MKRVVGYTGINSFELFQTLYQHGFCNIFLFQPQSTCKFEERSYEKIAYFIPNPRTKDVRYIVYGREKLTNQ